MMSAFKGREIDLIICTTVIEVGIDVPNATVIVIEHAERFGLAQLHQLRGRVGRGLHPSKCLLIVAAEGTEQAGRRIKVMEETADGFRIAEEDLEMRGPGEMVGVRQSGIPHFRIGDVRHHGEIMVMARRLAREALTTRRLGDAEQIESDILNRWRGNNHLFTVA